MPSDNGGWDYPQNARKTKRCSSMKNPTCPFASAGLTLNWVPKFLLAGHLSHMLPRVWVGEVSNRFILTYAAQTSDHLDIHLLGNPQESPPSVYVFLHFLLSLNLGKSDHNIYIFLRIQSMKLQSWPPGGNLYEGIFYHLAFCSFDSNDDQGKNQIPQEMNKGGRYIDKKKAEIANEEINTVQT